MTFPFDPARTMLDDKSILITGGTGSFGRHAVRTLLARHRPKRLVVYSRDEHKQEDMSQEFNAPCMRYLLIPLNMSTPSIMAMPNSVAKPSPVETLRFISRR